MALVQGVWFASFPKDRIYRTWPDFNGSWLHFVGMQTLYGLHLLLGGAALSALFTATLLFAGIPNPAVLVLFLLIATLAAYWLAMGIRASLAKAATGARGGEPTTDLAMLILAHPAAQLAFAMFEIVGFVLLLILGETGWDIIRAQRQAN